MPGRSSFAALTAAKVSRFYPAASRLALRNGRRATRETARWSAPHPCTSRACRARLPSRRRDARGSARLVARAQDALEQRRERLPFGRVIGVRGLAPAGEELAHALT